MPRWRVDLIGKHPQHMGMVEADDARSALQEAINLRDKTSKEALRLAGLPEQAKQHMSA